MIKYTTPADAKTLSQPTLVRRTRAKQICELKDGVRHHLPAVVYTTSQIHSYGRAPSYTSRHVHCSGVVATLASRPGRK